MAQAFFPMSGEVEAGYNYQGYLLHQLQGKTRDLDPTQLAIFRQVRAQMKETKKKFCFPVTSYAGLAIGFFEVLFNLPSQFIYKVKVSGESAASSARKPVDLIGSGSGWGRGLWVSVSCVGGGSVER